MGRPDSGVSFSEGPLPWRPEQYVGLVDAVKAAVSVPVIAVGRIDADHGDALIAAGRADFVSMGRQLLADPDTIARLEAGRHELVRPCINCNTCVAENFWDATPVCAVNARLGRHHELDLVAAAPSRAVVVVGGGPAGMEAARVAALRGHRVTLLEASPRLGGTARFSALTTPVNGRLVDHLDAAVREAGVEVRLATSATPELLATMAPDVIVVATGARRERPDVPGADLPHVLSGDDLRAMLTGEPGAAAPGAAGGEAAGAVATARGGLPLAARVALAVGARTGLTNRAGLVRSASQFWMPIGERVVVVGGSLVGVELAEFLAERGRSVTVLEPGRVAGVGMAHPRRWRALHEARSHGVTFVTDAELVEITPTDVAYRLPGDDSEKAGEGHEADTGGSGEGGVGDASGKASDQTACVAADTVIVASGVHPDPGLAERLRADASIGAEVHVVGDAADVDYIVGAIRTAHDLALTL
jgi:NADPH-dependent 2,4-dienoyl-CoA reductase/sulfur reductase-like enzyme